MLLTSKYTVEVHLATFEYMAESLAPFVDRCIFSFAELYKKFRIQYARVRTKNVLPRGRIAKKYSLTLQTCASEQDYSQYGIRESGCVTLDILGRANGIEFRKLKHTGYKCAETRGIGDYDTCPNGCKYCCANKDPKRALENYRLHDPDSPILLGHINASDIIKPAKQISFLKKEPSF